VRGQAAAPRGAQRSRVTSIGGTGRRGAGPDGLGGGWGGSSCQGDLLAGELVGCANSHRAVEQLIRSLRDCMVRPASRPRRSPWGARSRVSCCVLVLVDQPTEDIAAAKLTSGRYGHRISNHRRHRRRVGQAAVRHRL
jgi:hypothetical protein